MSISGRLRKLEQATGPTFAPGECPGTGAHVVLLEHLAGEPVPPIPENAPRCPLCGEVHVVQIVIEIVE